MNGTAYSSTRGVLLFAALALFLFLGTRGLNEPDEGRYAEIGRETAAGAGWLVPKLNGFAHLQKPPVIYWITAVSLRLLGNNEWSARLPSGLAALATVALTLCLGRLLFDRATGLLAALILLSSVEFFALARTLTPDMTLTCCIVAAIVCFVRYSQGGGRRWCWLFFGAMGLGFLVKGPLALVVPISAALGWQRAARGSELRRPVPWVPGLLLTLAIGLWWFIYLGCRYRELVHFFLGDELVGRFASKHHGRSQPFWFFGPVLLVGLLPWTFLLPGHFRAAWRRLRARGAWAPREALLACWIVMPLLILSVSGSKLSTYVLPLYPALALALAHGLERRAVVPRWAVPLATGSVALWVAGSVLLTMPRVNDALKQQGSVRDLARIAFAQPDFRQARLFACQVRAHGFEFYTGRLVSATEGESDNILPPAPLDRERLIPSPEDCEGIMLASHPAYGIVRSQEVKKYFKSPRWNQLGKAGDFTLLGTRAAPAAAPVPEFPLPAK